MLIDAGRNLSIVEGRNTRSTSIDVDKKRSSAIFDPVFMQNKASGTGIDVKTDTAAASTITSSQGGVLLQGGGVVHLQGVQVAAAKDIRIEGGEVYITAATNRSEVSGQQRQRGGDFGPLGLHDLGHGLGAKAGDTLGSETTSLARTTLSGANVRIAATGPDATGGELHIAGTTVNTPGTLSLNAETLYLETQSTVATLETGSQRKDFAWQQQGSRGTSDETTNYNQFNAGNLTVNANRVQAGIGARDSLEQLARQPGMGWVEQLNNDPNLIGKVDWVKVEEAHRNWDHKQQGLTPEGAAIVTLAVAWATWGAASGAGAAAGEAVTASGVAALGEGGFVAAGGLTASSVVGGAVTAGVTALAGQASVALINNRGDIAGALDDLGSSASVKNLLSAIVTGGVLAGLNLNPTGLPTVGGGAQPFMTQLGQNLTAGAARALIGTAINGGSFEENLKEGLKGAILDTVAAQTAFAIGGAQLDDFTNKVAHAVAGCAVGAARASDGCAAGAIGAVIGEISGEAFGFDENGNPKPAATQFAAMLGGIGAAIAGLDVDQINLASGAAANAAANNALKHYVDRALSKLADGLKALELKPLVEKQQLIREYLEKAGARGGLTDSEISALGVIYAANEALFPTSVLDVFPGGGKAVSKAGTLIKAGATAEDVAKVAVAESRAMREAAAEASSLANAARLRMQLKAEEVAGVPLPVEITGYSRHGLNQAISRDGAGVSPDAILDAFKNPISITGQSGGRFMLTGKDAVVVVNGQGRVITTCATGASGVRQP